MRNYLLVSILSLCLACSKNAATNSGATSQNRPSNLQADGTINGGGGVGIRCGDKLETLDVFEARRDGLKLLPTPSSQNESVQLVASHVLRHFWNMNTIPIQEKLASVSKDIITPIFEGRPFKNYSTQKDEEVLFVDQLPLSNDYGKYTVPNGCHLEQIAIFSDTKTQLTIVKSAWQELDWLSKSFLVAHELLYLLDRREGLNKLNLSTLSLTSERTRKFVGKLFSTTPPAVHADGVPSEEHLFICSNADNVEATLTYFYAFNTPETGDLTAVFNSIYGASDLYQLRADFKKINVKQMLEDATSESFTSESDLVAVDSQQTTSIKLRLEKKANSPIFISILYLSDGKQKIVGSQKLTCNKF